MRKIRLLIIHCSDSDHPKHDNIDIINRWHLERGFTGVGYQYFIRTDGLLEIGRPMRDPGAHCKGFNHSSVGICLSGKEVFTKAQFDTLEKLCINLMDIFELEAKDILGHSELNDGKSCPNFDIQAFRQKLI
jgi:N-acetylmuramoyl-L-alanine amidase